MSQEKPAIPPPVMWAQKNGQIFVTFCLEDCKNPTVKIEPDNIYFKGIGGTEQKEHEVTINFYKEIDPGNAVQNSKGRLYEVILSKMEYGPQWPRLTKEKNKFHWLKSDFNKFHDDEDSENDEQFQSFEKNLGEMGYFNHDDAIALGGDDDEGENRDSDDDLPDLE